MTGSHDHLSAIATVAPHIHPDTAQEWIDTLTVTEPGRIAWHIRRLAGFGGSDMGVLIAEQYGQMSPFLTARDIIADKLCLRAPQPPTGDMERGMDTEAICRRKFRALYDLRPHPAAPALMRSFATTGLAKKHPWLVGNPDDILIDEEGGVWLVDYKTPADPNTIQDWQQTEIPIYYKAQLHHYRLILEAAGIAVDHMALVPFSVKDWSPVMAYVPLDEQLCRDILTVGDAMWARHVLAGCLPEPPELKQIVRHRDIPAEVGEIVARFALAKHIELSSSRRVDDLKRQLMDAASRHRIGLPAEAGGARARLGVLDIGYVSSRRPDTGKMLARLAELGEDTEAFMKESGYQRMELLRGKRGDEVGVLNEIKAVADDYLLALGEQGEIDAIDCFQHLSLLDEQAVRSRSARRKAGDDAPAP